MIRRIVKPEFFKSSRIWFNVLLLVAIFQINVPAQVVINELMPSNTYTYADIWDFEDFPDWIELYNSSSAQVDLSGYYLSDDFNDLKQWAFPSGTKIAAGAYLVIIADGNDAKLGQTFTREFYPWDVKFQTKHYHTNFKLSADGDKLALSRDDGGSVVIVDSVSFSEQYSDISVGRDPSSNAWGVQFDLPTPGAANDSDPKNTGIFSGSVTFSVVGGFYDAAQTVILTADAGDIYYTTDGSIPDKRSQKYTGPVVISKTTPLRARCIEDGKFAGKTVTNTYFIGENKRSLMVVNLTTDSSWLYNADNGVFENSLKGRELPVAMEFFTTEGEQIVKVNAGLRLGSLTNFTCPQKPMQVALKGKYGDDYIWSQLFDKPVACFVGLRLRQGGDAWGSNLIADGLLESICKNQMDVGYQAYRPVVVYINGKYYGIQDLREKFDDQYFTNNYNVDPTSKQEVRTILVPPDGMEGWELVSGSWDSWQAVIDYVKEESMSDDSRYEKIKSQVNINSLIDYVALQEFGCNVSWGHNEDIWKTDSTKWQWLVTDFDRCFVNSLYGNSKTDIINTGGYGLSKSIMAQDTLFSKLINNDDFKAYFIQRLAAHLNSTFKSTRINAFVDSIVDYMTPEMDEYIAAWKSEDGALSSVTDWERAVDSLKTFITERPQYVFQHLSTSKFAPSGTAELTVTLSDALGGEIYINQVRMNQGLSAMNFFVSVPMEVKAVANPGYVFAGWSEGGNESTINLTITGDKTLEAKFEKAEDHVIASIISDNTTFNLTDHPYVGSGDIKVAEGATLTIEKGVTVLMSQDANLTIEGRLLINGTEDEPVTITYNENAGATNWGAINFYNTTDTSKMVYVKISGTTLGSDALNEKAGINGNYANVIMDYLTVSNVVYPFYFEYGNTVLTNSSITIDHICNGGIHIGRGGAVVENNIWVSTGKTINTDAIDIKGVTDGIIRGNRLYNFNGFNSDGIDLGEGASNILVEGNYIYGNRDKGISCGGGSTCIVKNNIVVGCDLGIGIKDEGSKAELDHNTFIGNRIAIATYTKVFGRGGGTAEVKNCILSASRGASFYADEFSSATFSYCLSDMDVLDGTGNVCADPGFTDMLGFNFQLKEGSACINAGDPSSDKDSDGSIADIGAPYTFNESDFPAELTVVYTPSVVINELMTDDSKDLPSGDWIELYNPTSEPVEIGNWKIAKNGDIDYWEYIVDISNIDSSKFFTVPDYTTLPANGFIVLCRDLDAFKASYPDVNTCIGNLPFGIDSKETVLLFNDNDSLVNLVSYKKKDPWTNRKSGISYELKNASLLNYMPSNWGISNLGGTPGSVNAATPIIGGIVKTVLPNHFSIAQNYPNPFRLSTVINFALPQAEYVNIAVYNFAGRLLETLVNSKMDAGYHAVNWNARGYSPGVYVYRIRSGSFVQSRKVTIQ